MLNPVLQQWLLNLAIDFPISLHLLPDILAGDDRKPHALNVKSLKGFTLENGLMCLAELADSGFIEFEQSSPGEPQRIRPLDVIALMSKPGFERKISFRLTQAGGRAWEELAAPHWDQMDQAWGTPAHDNLRVMDWVLFSQNWDRLIALLGWWPMTNGGEENVDFRTVSAELAQEYEVMYWKRLPNVHVLKFQTKRPEDPPRGYKSQPLWFKKWCNNRFRWYRKPWELEGWPPAPPAGARV